MIIGLTGGMGTGKSTVAGFFADRGIPIIQTDAIGHTCLNTDPTVHAAVLAHFGPSIRLADQSLDRTALRRLIFQSPQERRWLEQLLHPRIKEALLKQCAQTQANPYLIIEVPLLFESDFHSIPDRSLVVTCDREHQIARIQARDRSDSSLIEAMLQTQLDPQTQVALADDCIDNNGSLADLKTRVDTLHEYYVQLCTPL